MSHSILVIGDGYLGTRIEEHFGDEAIITIADITKREVIGAAIDEHQPKVLINAAALTLTNDIEKPENQGPAFDVNVKGAINASSLARERGIHFVHLSTGMIFDGAGVDGKGFRETDKPQPTSYYTWTKAWADAALIPTADTDKTLIVRLHLPLSRHSHPRNLLNKLIRFDQFLDEPGSITVVEDLLTSIQALVEQQATGVFHVVNPGVISMYEIAELLQKHGLIPAEKVLKKINKADFDAMIKNSGGAYQPTTVLNTEKLESKGITLKEVHQAVEECVENLAKELSKSGRS